MFEYTNAFKCWTIQNNMGWTLGKTLRELQQEGSTSVNALWGFYYSKGTDSYGRMLDGTFCTEDGSTVCFEKGVFGGGEFSIRTGEGGKIGGFNPDLATAFTGETLLRSEGRRFIVYPKQRFGHGGKEDCQRTYRTARGSVLVFRDGRYCAGKWYPKDVTDNSVAKMRPMKMVSNREIVLARDILERII